MTQTYNADAIEVLTGLELLPPPPGMRITRYDPPPRKPFGQEAIDIV